MTHTQNSHKMIKLDIGCWDYPMKWFLGIDKRNLLNATYILNLDKEKLPFGDESVDEIYSSHFLEHVQDVESVFLEFIRVLKVWSKMKIIVPFYSSPVAFDPSHKAFFNPYSFSFYVEWKCLFKVAPTYLHYTSKPYMRFNYFKDWKDIVFKPFEFFANYCTKLYVFSFAFIFPAHEIEYNFVKIKNFKDITDY